MRIRNKTKYIVLEWEYDYSERSSEFYTFETMEEISKFLEDEDSLDLSRFDIYEVKGKLLPKKIQMYHFTKKETKHEN